MGGNINVYFLSYIPYLRLHCMKKLYGIVPPMTTPFNEDEEINHELLKKDVKHLVEKSKVHGLAIGGSTGEGYSL